MGYRSFIREQIALGKLPYADKVHLLGYNAAISNSAETIWSPGATYAQLTTAVTLEAVSSSANDAAAGTGARTISVEYLDANYNVVTETITLNGTTPVALSTLGLAVNKLKILTAGSGLTNAGTVDIRTVSGSTVKRRIPSTAGQLGQSFDFLYTIPKGYIGLLCSVQLTASGATGTVSAYVLNKDSAGLIKSMGSVDLGISNTSINPVNAYIDFGTGILVNEKELIELRAITGAGAGIMSASAELLLFSVAQNGLF